MPLLDSTGKVISYTKAANYDPHQSVWLVDSGQTVADTNPPSLHFVPPAPTVSVTQFKMLFGSALAGILAAKSTDATLQALFYIIDDPRTTSVDLSLQTVQADLDYMVSKNYITAAQKTQILTGAVL